MRRTKSLLGGLSAFTLAATVVLVQPVGAGTTSLQTWTCDGIEATIVGTPGSETLMGTPGVDVIAAREGNDTIYGLGGDDIVCGGKGDDVIYGGDGFDILFRAQGNDQIYSNSGTSIADRADTRGARMFGGADNDRIYGSNRWDRMQGGPGNDQLFGYEGRDWLRAGPGNDAVNGGPGIDDQHGGNGRDDIEMTNGDIVRGGAGLDLCRIGSGEPSFFRSCGFNERETAPRGVIITRCDFSEEFVDILNDSQAAVTLTGWQLHDLNFEHSFMLDGITLQVGGTVRILSGTNPVASPGQVVGWSNNVWNNTGDTAFLLDANATERSMLTCT